MHLVGATTYAGWAAYWPGASGPFAKPMNEIPKVVFSDSLASADWGETAIAAGDWPKPSRGSSRSTPTAIYSLTAGYGLGAGERLFLAPLTIQPMSTTVFSGGAVAHAVAAAA